MEGGGVGVGVGVGAGGEGEVGVWFWCWCAWTRMGRRNATQEGYAYKVFALFW